MKSLIAVCILAIFLTSTSSRAADGLTTSVEPTPPYSPGMQIRVRVSGPGISQLQPHATFQMVGAGRTDFMGGGAVTPSGTPPGFEYTFTVPKYANTNSPTIQLWINSKNGVEEKLTAENTPAFAPKFTGLTVDREGPKLSNFKFERTGNGSGMVTFDAVDQAGVDSTGGNISMNPLNLGFTTLGGTTYATEFTSCEGAAPNFKCTSQMTFPPGSSGKMYLNAGVADEAGNRTDFNEGFDIGSGETMDSSDPAIAGPVRVSVCGDGTMRTDFDMSGGGGGIFQGYTNFWSTNNWLGNNSSNGIASQGRISCSNGHCTSEMAVPELVGLEKGSLTAQVGGESSGTGVGGIETGHNFRITMDAVNGKNFEIIYPQEVVDKLLAPADPQSCNLYDINNGKAEPAGTRAIGDGEGTR